MKQQGLLLERLQERLLDQSRVSAPLPAAGAAEHRDTVSRPPTQAEAQSYAAKAEALSGKVDGILKSVGGFQFSGDFRYRTDVAVRSGNSAAGPVQNIRARYRLRFNIDKELDPRFRFHQNQRRASDPSDQFFVPLPRGAGTTFRYQGQFAFTF